MMLTHEHELFRGDLGAFDDAEIAPNLHAWDEAQTFPRERYRRAARIGLLGLGGMGCIRGTKSERSCRDVAVMMIGGSADEIMNELAARQLGV